MTDEHRDLDPRDRGMAPEPAAERAAPPCCPYAAPQIRPAPAVELRAAAGAAPGDIAIIEGVEIAQVVQSLDNDVPLIAGKTTIVRIYVDPQSFTAPAIVTGEIAWRRGTGGWSFLPAMNRVDVGPAVASDLHDRRHDAAASLNFKLPADAVREGDLSIRLNRLMVPGGADVPFDGLGPTADLPGVETALAVSFRGAPVLRIRAVGLRYRSVRDATVITPDATHFAHLRSFLVRTYPTAEVEWSQIVVDGDNLVPQVAGGFPAFQSNLVNAQLLAIRAREVASGRDPRTHYYGLVDFEGGSSFMRGAAIYDEMTEVFGPVACGPCGVPSFWVWDTDPTFADWYGCHELSHTFQRRHPGFPPANQPPDPLEKTWPYPGGFITDNSVAEQRKHHVGFDVGDPDLGLPMAALPGSVWHDVMTYADRQWMSAYTFNAILDQLLHEDAVLAPQIS
ncbi:hypothetical protein [Acuticoccus sediminis]|uniref:hypothetical protein n=1 Tax=Acuticoccus sediminis TaxID=2184697 RepID=UPI001CFD7DB3|nr:hypothetical protein [Acuticoccus sediminis]